MSKQIKESKITKTTESTSGLKKDVNKLLGNKVPKTESSIQNSIRKVNSTSTEKRSIAKPKLSVNQKSVEKSSIPRTERNLETKRNVLSKPVPKPIAESSKQIKPKLESTKGKLPLQKVPGKINSNKSNQVLDTYHNVTVLSPPSVRKNREPRSQIKNQNAKPITKIITRKDSQSENQPRIRSKTRTLEPDEVIVLRNKLQIDENTSKPEKVLENVIKSDIITVNLTKKPAPVAFEINFNESKDQLVDQKVLDKNETDLMGENIVQDEYESDFESYESDFESSSAETEETSETESTHTEDNTQDERSENLATDDDSEEMHPPITVIHLETKESENKLDSGNYDLPKLSPNNSGENNSVNAQLTSLDEITTNSEKFDSGLEEIGNSSYNLKDNIINTMKTHTKFSQRGIDLMKKIKLDSVSYYLFEMRPVNYDYFMKIYGNFDCIQTATQTNENYLHADTQTNECQQRSMWTQHPPQYDLKFLRENGNVFSKNSNLNCCDEFEDLDSGPNVDPLINSINKLNRFRRKIEANKNTTIGKNKTIDYDKLNEFLYKSSLTISAILNKKNNNHSIAKTDLNFSSGYIKLNLEFLNALQIVKIYSNINCDLLFTIHECKDEIYRNDFLNLIIVWNVKQLDKPIRLLSAWSEVIRVDLCLQSPDIIVAGLRDGSIALWDLRETYSYCSKLDGYLTHFAATYSIAPSLNDISLGIDFNDLGSLVDIKSFKSDTTSYNLNINKQIQFASLNDTGILTIWTLVETGQQNFSLESNYSDQNILKIEYQSPWARIKLIQSAICDLRQYLEIKNHKIQSKFEKTKSYFENDIFNDETLRELQATSDDSNLSSYQGLRFNCIDTTSDLVFIANNRNFIILCSKTLKSDRFRKIYIDDSKFLFPTSLRLYPTNNDYLIVGLSNGSVKIINCNLSKTINNQISDENISKKNDDSKENMEIGKSCAIQNIILNERKSFDDFDENNIERPKTALSDFYDNNNNFENAIFDQQIIFNGSVLRKCLVENIEISLDGKFVYILSDGQIRIYDFKLKNEIDIKKNIKVKCMCMNRGNSKEQPFISILNADNEVQVHNVKL